MSNTYIIDPAVYKAVKFAQHILGDNPKDFFGAEKACRTAATYWKANVQETRKLIQEWLWQKIRERALGHDGWYTIFAHEDRYMMDDYAGKNYALVCPDCGHTQFFWVNSSDADKAFVSECPDCGYVDCKQRAVIRRDLYQRLVKEGIIPD